MKWWIILIIILIVIAITIVVIKLITKKSKNIYEQLQSISDKIDPKINGSTSVWSIINPASINNGKINGY